VSEELCKCSLKLNGHTLRTHTFNYISGVKIKQFNPSNNSNALFKILSEFFVLMPIVSNHQ
jgi:hypothetical protein